jgi:hypothetical protein
VESNTWAAFSTMVSGGAAAAASAAAAALAEPASRQALEIRSAALPAARWERVCLVMSASLSIAVALLLQPTAFADLLAL